MGSYRDFVKNLTASITAKDIAASEAQKKKERQRSSKAPAVELATQRDIRAARAPSRAVLARSSAKAARSLRRVLAQRSASTSAVADIARIAKKALTRSASESPRRAIVRLRSFAQTTVKAKWRYRLTVKAPRPPRATAVAAAFAERSARAPKRVSEVLLAAAGLSVRGRDLELELVTLRDLDYDHWGRLLSDPRYANVLNLAPRGFSLSRVEDRFVRCCLARYTLPDEEQHEDGDVAAIFIPLDKSARREPVVWQIPYDDGYRHTAVAPDASAWLSLLVDRIVRCTALREAGVEHQ